MDIKPNTELANFLTKQGESLKVRIKEAGRPTPPSLVAEFKVLSILQIALDDVKNPEHIAKIESVLRSEQ